MEDKTDKARVAERGEERTEEKKDAKRKKERVQKTNS